MFDGAVNVLDYVMEDYMVLANYLESFPVDKATGLPTIGADSIYKDVKIKDRITVSTTPVENEKEAEAEVVVYKVKKGDCLWSIAAKTMGSGTQWRKLYKANKDTIKNPALISVGQKLIIPAA